MLTGPYGKLSSVSKLFSGISLKKVIDSKHGISLGALQQRIPEVLLTKDGKINIADEVFLKGLDKVAFELEQHPYMKLSKQDFLLIGRRNLRTNNSWMHNIENLAKGKNKCTVMMHSADAEKHNLEDAVDVIVTSETGKITIPLEITDTLMPGVVSIPHGFGHIKKGIQLDIASKPENAGVSVNDITDHNRIDPVTGNAAFSGQIVQILSAI